MQTLEESQLNHKCMGVAENDTMAHPETGRGWSIWGRHPGPEFCGVEVWPTSENYTGKEAKRCLLVLLVLPFWFWGKITELSGNFLLLSLDTYSKNHLLGPFQVVVVTGLPAVGGETRNFPEKPSLAAPLGH